MTNEITTTYALSACDDCNERPVLAAYNPESGRWRRYCSEHCPDMGSLNMDDVLVNPKSITHEEAESMRAENRKLWEESNGECGSEDGNVEC